jgi:hypothetical protein
MYKAQAGIIECRDAETVERKMAATAISLYSPPYKVLLFIPWIYIASAAAAAAAFRDILVL